MISSDPFDSPDEVLADLLERLDNGEPIDRQQIARQYPHLADELIGFLDDSDAVSQALRHADRGAPGYGAATRFGPYELIAPLGAGGMGEVYRARDTRLAREVALKLLPPEFVNNADRLARFEREFKAVAALAHPNILVLHDIGTDQGVPYAVTELLEGETLRRRLGEGALLWRKAVEIGR
jgi:hypothetical protein